MTGAADRPNHRAPSRPGQTDSISGRRQPRRRWHRRARCFTTCPAARERLSGRFRPRRTRSASRTRARGAGQIVHEDQQRQTRVQAAGRRRAPDGKTNPQLRDRTPLRAAACHPRPWPCREHRLATGEGRPAVEDGAWPCPRHPARGSRRRIAVGTPCHMPGDAEGWRTCRARAMPAAAASAPAPKAAAAPCAGAACTAARPGGQELVGPAGRQGVGHGHRALDHLALLFAHGHEGGLRAGQAVAQRLAHQQAAQRLGGVLPRCSRRRPWRATPAGAGSLVRIVAQAAKLSASSSPAATRGHQELQAQHAPRAEERRAAPGRDPRCPRGSRRPAHSCRRSTAKRRHRRPVSGHPPADPDRPARGQIAQVDGGPARRRARRPASRPAASTPARFTSRRSPVSTGSPQSDSTSSSAVVMSSSSGALVRKRATPPPRSASWLARKALGAASMHSTLIRRRSGLPRLLLGQAQDAPLVADLGVGDEQHVARHLARRRASGSRPAPGPRPARCRRCPCAPPGSATASSTTLALGLAGAAAANQVTVLWNRPSAKASRSVSPERNCFTAQSAACHLAPSMEPEWSTSRIASRAAQPAGRRVAGGAASARK